MNLIARLLFSTLLAVSGLLSCQQPATQTTESPSIPQFTETDRQAILDAMQAQENCWNKADVDCFMEYYWKSDSLTFTGKSGINEGWQATYDRYKAGYPDAAAMGTLQFDILKFRVLAHDAVHLIGKWDLQREMGDLGGYFSLIWRKIDDKWVIVADHTS